MNAFNTLTGVSRKLILFSLLTFSLLGASAQNTTEKIRKNEVPEKVLAAFNRLYSQIDKPLWSKNGAHYEAEFNVNFKNAFAEFDSTGKWLRSDFIIHKNELRGGFPAAIVAYLDNNYKGAEINSAHIQLSPSGKIFIVKLDPDKNKKTDNKLNLYFAENGSYIRQESRK